MSAPFACTTVEDDGAAGTASIPSWCTTQRYGNIILRVIVAYSTSTGFDISNTTAASVTPMKNFVDVGF